MTGENAHEDFPPAHLPLAGRRALISGAASGIGRACARFLADRGCRVLTTDLAPPAAGAWPFHAADLTRGEQVDALFAAARERLGTPDVLIGCAGVGLAERLEEGDPEKWRQLFEVNVLGTLRLLRAFVPAMGGGDVVLLGSVAAGQAHPYGGPYGASKAALEQIAETLRLETQPRLRVTTVSPGVVDTAFFAHMLAGNQTVEDIGFGHISPEQIAELIAYAISRPPNMALSHITVRPRGQPF